MMTTIDDVIEALGSGVDEDAWLPGTSVTKAIVRMRKKLAYLDRLRAENERLGKEVENAVVEIEALREVLAQIIAITESDGRPLKQMHEIHTLAFMTLQPNA